LKRVIAVIVAAAVIFISILTSGCANDIFSEKEQTITVVTLREKEDFDRLYGNAFAQKHPNIKLKLTHLNYITMNSKSFENQDVIMFPVASYFQEFANAGKLMEFDRNMLDIQNLYSPVISYIEKLGNGRLYGLSNSFSTQGLQFDKQMFAKYNVEYPKDGMTWEEIIQTAKKFSISGGGDMNEFMVSATRA